MSKVLSLRLFSLLGLLAGFCILVALFLPRQPRSQVRAQVVGFDSEPAGAEFERITGPRQLTFPRDHGAHPDFLTEWWYYTGNLQARDGRRFGYQLTFFRRALQSAAQRSPRASHLAAEQIYMAHLALTDVSGSTFHAFERFERGAAGLAGASGDPVYRVWLRDWSVEQVSENVYQLHAAEGAVTLDLRLVDTKGLILQGDQGYSQKGPEIGNASIYYSQTRLESSGAIILDGISYPVTGLSWLDREISTSALSEGQVGWDWFALQMEDGSELMAYVLRRSDGSVDSFSRGAFIRPDGTRIVLPRDEFQIQPEGTWRSPHSGADYPARWKVSVPSLGLVLRVEPLIADQELNLSFIYWEGAVQVKGTRDGRDLVGSGYVELTGYARSLAGGL